jgi:signal recognition particle subunit SRP54
MARPHRTIVQGAPTGTLRYTAPASMRQNPRITRPDAARLATTVGPPLRRSPDRAVFDTLSERLRATLGTLTGRGRISEADVDAAMREVRLALLEADVNFKVVRDFVARVREKALGQDILQSLTAGQAVVKIVHDELVDLLGTGDRVFHLSGNPAVVAMVGLQGSGKTTTTAKLARYVIKQGRRPLLVAADPYRPAAADQLETLGKQLDVPVYRAPEGTSVPDIARQGVEAAKRGTRDVVILDTAGRLSVDEALMREIAAVEAAVKPVETLLVVDAMTGQEAVAVAQAFVAAVPVTGLILTKIDGDARGGAALSISAVTGLPVKFLGTGEKTDALEPFHPDRLAGRILGMGDILTLVERAQETFDVNQAQQMEEKLRKASFTLEDMLDQLQQVQKMGPIGQIMSMIPGMGNMAGEAQAAVDRGDLKRTEAIIRAMTPAERRDPAILTGSRRRRIAAGAGTSLPEVNRLVKQFGEMQKLMKQLSGGGRRGALGSLMGNRR